MYMRTKERAIPPIEIDSSVPKGANDIVVKCLEIERERRYQSVTETLNDLETFDPSKKAGATVRVKTRLRRVSRYRNRTVAIALLAVAVVAGFMLRNRFLPGRSTEHAPMTLLVADFANTTGDSIFSSTLEAMFTTALEEAAFINTYRRDQARALLGRLENGETKLDEPAARKIAVREGINVMVTGSIARAGAGYQISAKAINAVTGETIATKQIRVANAELVLASVGSLVAPIRKALGDTTPESAQLAAAQTYAAHSLEAAHAYALGMENEAKPDEAIRHYLHAVELDPAFGQAYARLAEVHIDLGKQVEADEYYKKAVAVLDGMSEREKYRTLAGYYLSAHDYEQCIEQLGKLVFLYPADGAAYDNRGTCYARAGNMTESVAASRRAVELSPVNPEHRYNYALHSMYAGDFTTAVAEAGRLVQQDPSFRFAYLTLALSALFRGDTDKAVETYRQLEKISSLGASLSKTGLADLRMYAGRYQDAVEILRTGIATDEKEGNSRELARKLATLAEAHNALGRRTDAAAAAARALQANDLDEGTRFLAARALIEAGEDAKTEQLVAELQGKPQKQTRSLAFMIAGDIALKQNRLPEAVDAYREAQKLHDSWLSHLLLGKAYVQAGHFPEALAELETGEKRASEATDLFDSNTPSLHYLPPLYYWLGRAQEGLGTADSARTSYQRFIAMREHADSADKLAADARSRAGQ
jgi:tetratricopeptide (TPR) repeat protein